MVGQFASQTAIWVMTIAAQVLLVRRGESTLTIALLQSAVTLPFLIFTIPSGVLADLVSRRTVLIVTNIGAVCVGIALPGEPAFATTLRMPGQRDQMRQMLDVAQRFLSTL